MKAKYIIRMDDACPEMHPDNWKRMEEILDLYEVRPVVAVIPDNKDTSLFFGAPDLNFWDIVKRWDNKGWEIALHGFNHLYNSEGVSIVPMKTVSEFSGLTLEEQATKLRNAVKIFREKGYNPKVFIAPGHAFDKITLKALKETTDINIISDGFFRRSVTYLNFKWVPQQIWRPRRMPAGLWTICLHPNTMTSNQFEVLEAFVKENKHRITSIDAIQKYPRLTFIDRLFFSFFKLFIKLKT